MNRQAIIAMISESPLSAQLKAVAIMGVTRLSADKVKELAEVIAKARPLIEAQDTAGFTALVEAEAAKANIPPAMLKPILAQLNGK